jgi:cobalt-zinc-cadmium efflux system outer membrane protein
VRHIVWPHLLLCCLAAAGAILAADSARVEASTYSGAPSDSLRVAPPVEELVALALRRAPSIAATAARAAAAQEMVSPAGALPDPSLEIMLQDEGFPDWTVGEMPMSMIGPQLSQGIPFPGKRGARRAAAREEAQVRERESEAMRRDVAREVREIYGRLYALDREAATLDAGRELLGLLSETVIARQSVGEADQEAVFKSRLARSRLEERSRDLAAERAMALASLNRLLDRAGDAPLGIVASLPHAAIPAVAWDSLAVRGSSQVMVRAAGVTAAEARLHAAKLDARPDFMAGAGIGFRGGLDPVVNFRLGMEIPLWSGSKQRPLTRAARAELEASRQELRGAEAEARSAAASVLADLARTEEQITRYEESLVPQTSLAFDAARSAYLGGRGDFSTVVEDLNLWIEARAGHARREADRFVALARLDALTAPAPELGVEGDSK